MKKIRILLFVCLLAEYSFINKKASIDEALKYFMKAHEATVIGKDIFDWDCK